MKQLTKLSKSERLSLERTPLLNKKFRSVFFGVFSFESNKKNFDRYIDVYPMSESSEGKRSSAMIFGGCLLSGSWCTVWFSLLITMSFSEFIPMLIYLCGFALVISLIPFVYSILKPVDSPVRFHRKNQEVYVYHENEVYMISWNNLKFSKEFDQVYYPPVSYTKEQSNFVDRHTLYLHLEPEFALDNGSDINSKFLPLIREEGDSSEMIMFLYVTLMNDYMNDKLHEKDFIVNPAIDHVGDEGWERYLKYFIPLFIFFIIPALLYSFIFDVLSSLLSKRKKFPNCLGDID